ncbi:SNF2 DNA repair protein [Perkinsela sp. CCAP 1560/4]|nr:SNF2 DNA repair protein [Perkinsela sp. CCAP 1560/4]|eukprot:KNH08884.1 SNF2 DNA repair protein [Perkinsela sp. CCAP 1560/4]
MIALQMQHIEDPVLTGNAVAWKHNAPRTLVYGNTVFVPLQPSSTKISLQSLKGMIRKWYFTANNFERITIICEAMAHISEDVEVLYGYIGLFERFRIKYASYATGPWLEQLMDFLNNGRIDLLPIAIQGATSLSHERSFLSQEKLSMPIDASIHMGQQAAHTKEPTTTREIKLGTPYPYTYESNYEKIITENYRIMDGEETLVVFVKNAVPHKIRAAASQVLAPAATATDNRRLVNSGLPPNSGIVGYYDYLNTPHSEKCRLTAFSRANESSMPTIAPFVRTLEKVYQTHAEKHHRLQNTVIPPPVRLFDTVFSTLTVNDTFRTALHTDSGDFKKGLGIVTVLDGDYEGVFLAMPRLEAAFDIRPGDVLLFNTDLLHGNTEPRCEKWNRLAVVAYLRTNLFASQCMEVYASTAVDPGFRKLSQIDHNGALHILSQQQRDGFQFAHRKLTSGTGALLSLEMGLGKTLLALALCNTFFHNSQLRKILVLCPCVVMPYWCDEYSKWATSGYISFPIFTLSNKDRKARQATLHQWDQQKGVLICGYERYCILNEREANSRESLGGADICILDEGHRLKNRDTKIFEHLFSVPTKRRVVLSGTPVQNDLGELHTLLKWTDASLMPNEADFKRCYTKPIRDGLHRNASLTDRRRAIHSLYILQTRILSSISVRHRARELPPLRDFSVLMNPSKRQNQLLQFFPGKTLRSTIACSHISAHPQLLLEASNALPNATKWREREYQSALEELRVERTYLIGGGDTSVMYAHSPKLTFVQSVVRHATVSRQKLVIFSNYTRVLDWIELCLINDGYGVLRIDGETRTRTREENFQKFKDSSTDEFPVLLLSIRATGVGVNLNYVSIVILFEPAYNPTIEYQAIARAHRFGQKQTVTVYRLMLNYLQELHVFRIQSEKHKLNRAVIDCLKSTDETEKSHMNLELCDDNLSDDPLIRDISLKHNIIHRVLPAEELIEDLQSYFTEEEVAALEREHALFS